MLRQLVLLSMDLFEGLGADPLPLFRGVLRERPFDREARLNTDHAWASTVGGTKPPPRT